MTRTLLRAAPIAPAGPAQVAATALVATALGALACAPERGRDSEMIGRALTGAGAAAPGTARKPRGSLPVYFEENRGQAPARYRYLSRRPDANTLLAPDEIVLLLTVPVKPDGEGRGSRVRREGAVLRMRLQGGNANAPLVGIGELPGKVNYLLGSDPAGWRRDVRTFARVGFDAVYPGVNLVVHGDGDDLEYDFLVAPGADPGPIALSFEGADRVEITDGGELRLVSGSRHVAHRKPAAWQESGGIRKEVAVKYVMKGAALVAFEFGPYDRSQTLVIDPPLAYSTYVGGSGSEVGRGLAIDDRGHAYVTGHSSSLDFPVTAGAFDTSHTGLQPAAFVTKVDPTVAGPASLVYATYLGGTNGGDQATAIAVDGAYNAYVVGWSTGNTFPLVGAYEACKIMAAGSAFFSKLGATGSSLLYSTCLEGNNVDEPYDVAVDAGGVAHITGRTASSDFPTTAGAYRTSLAGIWDSFAVKIDPAKTGAASLVYATYFGDCGSEWGDGIALDAAGVMYLSGSSEKSACGGGAPLPWATGALEPRHADIWDAYLTKLDPSLPPAQQVVFNTFIGGGGDVSTSQIPIALDGQGNAHVAGITQSTDLTITPNAFQTVRKGTSDMFVGKFSPTGTKLYMSYLGGQGFLEYPYGLAVDAAGRTYLAGFAAPGLPVTPCTFQGAAAASSIDAFLTVVDTNQPPASQLVYSTYLGGTGTEHAYALALDKFGNAYVTGDTDSTNFPLTNGFQVVKGGQVDTFLVKVPGPAKCGLPLVAVGDVAVVEGSAGTTTAALFPITLTAAAPGPVTVTFATADGTALAGSDYQAAAGSVTFAPGETQKTVAVQVMGDAAIEPAETFVLEITGATGDATVSDPFGLGTIANDDVPLLSVSDVSVVEGDAASTAATFTVSLTPGATSTVTVSYATADGTASAPADYTAGGGVLTFPPGTLALTVTVPVASDLLHEPDETFFLNLSSPSNAAIADGQGQGTIVNDDAAPRLRVDDVVVAEGQSGFTTAVFTVTLEGATALPATVQVATADGSAQSPGDYASTAMTLSFAPGETQKTFAVKIYGDTTYEGDEELQVLLSAAAGAVIVDGSGVGRIRDDDHCVVGGAIVPGGAANPANACQICDPALSTTAFSPKPAGAACSDGNACTQGDQCDGAGQCVGPTAVACAPPDECHQAGVCDPATGACSYAESPCAPKLGGAADVAVTEGQVAVATGSYADGNSADVVAITASVGSVSKTGSNSGAWTWSLPTTDGPDQSQLVTITATDASGGTATTTFSLMVKNAAPTVTLAGATTVPEGETRTYTFTVQDPGQDGFSVLAADCGSAGLLVGAVTLGPGAGGSFACSFPDGPDTTTVSVQVADSDGAASNTAALAVAVTNQPPQVTLAGPAAVLEGETREYAFQVVDLGVDGFTVSGVSCGSAGVLVPGSLATSAGGGTFRCRFPDGPATTTVSVQVSDSDGAAATQAALDVAIANVAPAVTLDGPTGVAEGDTKTYTFAVNDPGQDGFAVTAAGCGAAGSLVAGSLVVEAGGGAGGAQGGGSFACFFPNGPASSDVAVAVADSDGAAGSAAKTVTVAEAAPVLDLSGDATAGEGQTRTYSFVVTSPGGDAFAAASGFPDCGAAGL